MRIKRNFTLAGMAFGLLFPTISIVFLMYSEGYGLSDIKLLHQNNHLLFIIHTAPLILGAMAYLIGVKQEKIQKQLLNRENTIKERTQDLLEKNKSLETEIEVRTIVEKKLVKATKEAIDAKNSEQRFLANMSHEIRTPLNSIIGFSKILIDSNRDPESTGYLKSVKFASNHLLSIVNDILDMSKINAGKISFENTTVNLRDLIHGVIETVRITADNKKLALTYDLFSDEDILIKTDPVRLNQVLLNLLNNAIKFTQEGSVRLVVSNRSHSTDSDKLKLLFEIIDTGIGIKKESLKKVFEDFTQAEASTTRKFGGTGLGLSISKKIVELQNGTIGAESDFGVGSSFWFELEFELGEISELEANTMELLLQHELDQNIDLLVAEDNSMNRYLVETIFKQWGDRYKLTFAHNGLEAYEHVQKSEFDVVLMDLQMPEMDGFEATEMIRSLKSHKCNIPIIALTADVLATEKNKAFKVGMNHYVTKPIKPEILLSKIFECLNIKV